jgi:hypothetical protein
MDDVTAALKRRLTKLTEDFERDHPARAAARKAASAISSRHRRHGPLSPRRERERGRAADDLGGYFGMIDDLLGGVFDAIKSPTIEDRAYTLLRQLVETAVTLGRLSAPEGQSGRDAWSDQSSAAFVAMIQAVSIYLTAHPELEMRRGGFPVGTTFADRIRADLLAAMGLPADAKDPSRNAIVEALRAVRKRTLSR